VGGRSLRALREQTSLNCRFLFSPYYSNEHIDKLSSKNFSPFHQLLIEIQIHLLYWLVYKSCVLTFASGNQWRVWGGGGRHS
jgi:succinate dehydrogenase flavin-adding protein (antitoxin of CptAB toxin-antitoxin module)